MPQQKNTTETKPYPNNIRQCIKQRGYSIQEVVEEISIPRRTLTDYMSGNTPTPRHWLEKIAETIGCGIEDLISRPIQNDELQPTPAMSHSSTDQISSILLLPNPQKELLTSPPNNHTFNDQSEKLFAGDKETILTHTNSHDSIINSSAFDLNMTDKLDNAESIINLAWEIWFASRPSAVARSINKLLPNLEKIAHSSYPPGQTLRAKELTVRAHGLLGSVCLDALQNDTALFHYMQAHRFAQEIHDTDLTAIYLCLVGEVLRQQKDQTRALSYMENARGMASHTSNTAQGYILQLLAYAYGDTGQEKAFERTISEATDLLAFSGEGRDLPQKEFIPFETYEIRGKINRDLGKPLDAIPYLELAEKSLARADSVTPRWHALLEISRAQAYCDAGDITTGIELACKGFTMAYQCRSPIQMKRVRKLLWKLENQSSQIHPKVQDLKNLIYETYLRMDNEEAPRNTPLSS